jgi:hypothetical protein
MALPLPNVVPEVGPGGRISNVMNSIGQNANALTQGQAEAKYAPYTQYANALSKTAYANMLPYQIQSTILSNPVILQAFKDKPEALNAMMTNLMGSIPKGSQVQGNANIPSPDNMGSSQGGFLSMLMDRLRGGNSQAGNQNALLNQQTPMSGVNSSGKSQPGSNSGSPLLPSMQGGMSGVIGNKTAPFSTSPYKSGSLIEDTSGQPRSVPTESTKSAAQSSINAAERVAPQIEKLADLAAPFLSFQGKAQHHIQRLLNLADPTGQRELPTKYAEYRSILKAAPEALVKAYGLRPTNETIERMQQVIEPYNGETKEQYKERMVRQLESIKQEQIGISKKNLAEGFPLGEESKTSSGAKNLAKGLELPEFESKEKFREWYDRQPEHTKKAVRIKLGEK